MQAKLKPDYRFETINACAGLVFNKTDWRAVPAGQENDARSNPYLELREEPPAADTAVAEPAKEPDQIGPVAPDETAPAAVSDQADQDPVVEAAPQAGTAPAELFPEDLPTGVVEAAPVDAVAAPEKTTRGKRAGK